MAANPPSPSLAIPTPTVNVPWERIEQFVGQFTHDIRNGLNAVELQLTFLAEISTDPEAADEVKRLRASLLEITRQLQAMRVTTGTITLHLLEYPAPDFLEDLRERLDRRHADTAARIQWNVEAVAGGSLAVDPELSMSALLELLVNASHFTTPGTPIRLDARTDANCLSLTIREQSAAPPQISSQDWGRTPLLSGRRSAYGLGLFRARRIIEGQGGSLDSAYSTAEGTLTTTVTLPALKPAAVAR